MRDSVLPTSIDAQEADYLYPAASQIEGAGRGLFSAVDIFENEVIALFRGEILSDSEAKRRARVGGDDYFINLLDGSIMDCAHSNCFAKFANDALKLKNRLNAEITLNEDEEVCLVAIRTIKAGEEIFTSYGKAYWKKKNSKIDDSDKFDLDKLEHKRGKQ